MNKVKSVCFTGHRNIDITKELSSKLYNRLEILVNNGADTFLAGGAMGWDLLCEKTVLTLKEKYPNIKLHIIMPCSEHEQTKNWKNDNDREEYKKILLSADYIEICSNSLTNDCMKKRNARLIELANFCICYYDTRRNRSGTGQTIRMAQKRGLLLLICTNKIKSLSDLFC